MASVASMLKSAGYEVYGSDEQVYPPMSTFLTEQAIPILAGFNAAHLQPAPDLVVIGNAMSRGNPEVEYVLENKIPYKSLPAVLKEFFIQGKTSYVVTGTHGKTTSSALLAWLFEKNNCDPGFMIGGIPENFGYGAKVGTGSMFIVEGDEYDTAFFDKGPKFLHYLPDVVILNNIEFDHADIYNNLDEIKLNFRRLINLIPRNGLLIANGDDPNIEALLKYAFCPVITFGTNASSPVRIEQIVSTAGGSRFNLVKADQLHAQFEIPLFGEHNVFNTTAVALAGEWHGFSQAQIQAAFSTFKGIKKRLQLKAEVRDILIFDDFAHHPTAVKATLNGVRARFPQRRIWAVYEPRTSTAKRSLFFNQYLSAFDSADIVILGPIYRPDKVDSRELIQIEALVQAFHSQSKTAYHFQKVEHIIDFLKIGLKAGDVVLIMSNGSFDNIHDKLIHILK